MIYPLEFAFGFGFFISVLGLITYLFWPQKSLSQQSFSYAINAPAQIQKRDKMSAEEKRWRRQKRVLRSMKHNGRPVSPNQRREAKKAIRARLIAIAVPVPNKKLNQAKTTTQKARNGSLTEELVSLAA